MWKAAKWGTLTLAVALAIVLSGVVGYTVSDGGGPSSVETRDRNFGILSEIYGVLKGDFVNPQAVDPGSFQDGAIKGAIEQLGDAHTVYISPEEFALGVDVISGTFEGIGAQVDQDRQTGEIVIVAPFRDSPAEKAGVKPGDVVLEVNGESTEGWSVADAVKRIRGPSGTQIRLTVQHSGGATEELTITRGTVVIPTVYTHEILDSQGKVAADIAYIELQQFTEQTVNDLRKELNRVRSEDYSGLILDLRRNPGGSLNATVAVADMFLSQGVVLTQVDRDGKRTVYEAKSGGEATDIPMVVLVGPGSASGSEVLAGALRDNNRATLLGEKTFGKGSVNHLRQLSNGGALYVTIARWLTPSGEQIEGVGLKPALEVKPGDDELRTGAGPQLFAAIDHLRNSLANHR